MKPFLILLLAVLIPAPAVADLSQDPKKEYRYCGQPKRDALGHIIRSSTVYRAFRRLYPCPATHSTIGPCPGWSVDHLYPLALGGCDAVYNMIWMRNEIKSCAGELCKDRYEMKIFPPLPPVAKPAN